jgi:hypothetical protein
LQLNEGDNATDRTERRDFFDTFLVVCDFISWMTLLAEPEDPTAKRKIPIKTHTLGMQIKVRTYVFLNGCTAPLAGPLLAAFSFVSNFSSPVVETEVEKCFEGARDRPNVDGIAFCCDGA